MTPLQLPQLWWQWKALTRISYAWEPTLKRLQFESVTILLIESPKQAENLGQSGVAMVCIERLSFKERKNTVKNMSGAKKS